MKKYADKHRRPLEFNVGDKVLLKLTPQIWKKIHPTFHVSFLKPFHEDGAESSRVQQKRAPPVIRKEFDKQIEKILDHQSVGENKLNRRTDNLVQWKGENEEAATWELCYFVAV
ncbi:hypothetical protein ACOSQ4_000020 [Xanthoceras sorbifolium]